MYIYVYICFTEQPFGDPNSTPAQMFILGFISISYILPQAVRFRVPFSHPSSYLSCLLENEVMEIDNYNYQR